MKKRCMRTIAAGTLAVSLAFGSMAVMAASSPVTTSGYTQKGDDFGPGVVKEEEKVVLTEAVFVKDSPFGGEDRLVFKNDVHGEFVVLVSDMTVMPGQMEDGKTYKIAHSQIMMMSLPGQLPQVYSIRELDDQYRDSVAEVIAVDETQVTFKRGENDVFAIYTERLNGTEVKVGDECIVSHTDAMTRSLPGIYMDVNRVYVMPSAETAE